MSPRPWSMKGLGILVVTVTVAVLSFAVAVVVGGMATPKYGDLFAGFAMKSRLRFTTEAVILVPSVQVTPRRSVSWTCFAETTFHDFARPVAIFPGPTTES